VPATPAARAPGAGARSIAASTVGQFIDTELVHFSVADCVRSIPSALDGLKPSQRKVLHACFRRRMGAGAEAEEVKVAQLAAYVAEQTAYHHGEESLVGTIVGMAQGFLGANVVPLLHGEGQFGTRASGGKDAAAARYIYVRMGALTRLLFPAADDELLPRHEEEGKLLEPAAYVPTVPVVLINGAHGIGTGWSCNLPTFQPMQVLANARLLAQLDEAALSDDDAAMAFLRPMELWAPNFRGAFGSVQPSWAQGSRALCLGAASLEVVRAGGEDAGRVLVTELPVGVWTEAYKARLLKMQRAGEISSFTEGHRVEHVEFDIRLTADQRNRLLAKRRSLAVQLKRRAWPDSASLSDAQLALLHGLKLSSYVPVNNMHLFSAAGEIRRYASPLAILLEHARARRALYVARKTHQLRRLRADERLLANRARFVQLVNEGRVQVLGADAIAVESQLAELGFDTAAQLESAGGAGSVDGAVGADAAAPAESGAAADGDFSYLLRTPLRELTAGRVLRLNEELASRMREREELQELSEQQMWERELDALQEPFERLVKGGFGGEEGASRVRKRTAPRTRKQ
jgi:DNA topoisomerase-2